MGLILSNDDKVLLSVKVFMDELSEVQDDDGIICVWLDALVLDILTICGLESRADELLQLESLKLLRAIDG